MANSMTMNPSGSDTNSGSKSIIVLLIILLVIGVVYYAIPNDNEEFEQSSNSTSYSATVSSYPAEYAIFKENFGSSLADFDYLSFSSFISAYDKMVGEIDHLVTETKREDGRAVVYKIVAKYPKQITIESKPFRGKNMMTWSGLVLKYGEDYWANYGTRYHQGEIESWGAQRFVIWDSGNGDDLLIENLKKVGLGRIVPLLNNVRPKIKALILEKILIYTYVFNVVAGGPQYMAIVAKPLTSFKGLVDLFETGWIIPPKNKIRR